MKKMTKILAILATAGLLASFAGCTSTFTKNGSRAERGLKYGGPKEDDTLVLFDKKYKPDWEKVYAYAYYNGGERTNGAWPGVEMKALEKDLLFYTMPLGLEDALVIFNNGKGEQLPDVPIMPEAQMVMSEDGQWMPWMQ